MLGEPLSLSRLRAAFAGQRLGHEVQWHESCASTNDLAREVGVAGHPHGVTIFAESQTAGRGRRQNHWHAPRRRNLLFSVLLRPKIPPQDWPPLTMAAAAGVCRVIEAFTKREAKVKWPNDVYVEGKKIAGLLAEAVWQNTADGFLILGLGLNINQRLEEFPEELREQATSFYLQDGVLFDRTDVAIAILRQWIDIFREEETSFSRLLPEIRNRNLLAGKMVRAETEGGILQGIVEDVTSTGGLALSLPNAQHHILHQAERIREI